MSPVTRLPRLRTIVGAAILAASLPLAGGCILNPQPLPPDGPDGSLDRGDAKPATAADGGQVDAFQAGSAGEAGAPEAGLVLEAGFDAPFDDGGADALEDAASDAGPEASEPGDATDVVDAEVH
jgi:hypothetical protein